MNEYGFDKKHLPPKKVFGNTSETFIQKRRAGLEKYLQTLLKEFDKIPFPLAMFLDFQKYVSLSCHVVRFCLSSFITRPVLRVCKNWPTESF